MNDAPNAIAAAGRTMEMAGVSAAPLGAAPVAVVVVDGSCRIIGVNGAGEQIFGTSVEQLIGQPAFAIGTAFQACIEEALTFGTGIRREITAHAGSQTMLLVGTTVCKSATGEILSVVAEVQSADSIRMVGQNLENLDRLSGLGVVAAGVAHELKNALVAVRTFFDLLGAGECDPELRAVASAEVQRIERTIRQLLRGARQTESKMAPLSVHAMLQDALNLVRHELQTRRIELQPHLNAVNDRINGDERQIRHMVVNILVNAAEAMPDGGRLTIKTEVTEAWEREHVCVTISDTGPGIPRENLARLFSPFFTTKPDGTGLGLAISHRIATAHNGALQVESETGRGTSFRLLLPLI